MVSAGAVAGPDSGERYVVALHLSCRNEAGQETVTGRTEDDLGGALSSRGVPTGDFDRPQALRFERGVARAAAEVDIEATSTPTRSSSREQDDALATLMPQLAPTPPPAAPFSLSASSRPWSLCAAVNTSCGAIIAGDTTGMPDFEGVDDVWLSCRDVGFASELFKSLSLHITHRHTPEQTVALKKKSSAETFWETNALNFSILGGRSCGW